MGGSAGEIGGDVPFIGFVVECVYEAGGGDRGSKALEGAESSGLLEKWKDTALRIEAKGELVYTCVVNKFFLTRFDVMAVASGADEFGHEKPNGASYALRGATEERWRDELLCSLRSRRNRCAYMEIVVGTSLQLCAS